MVIHYKKLRERRSLRRARSIIPVQLPHVSKRADNVYLHLKRSLPNNVMLFGGRTFQLSNTVALHRLSIIFRSLLPVTSGLYFYKIIHDMT